MKTDNLSSENGTANGVNTVLTAGNFKPILFSTPMVQAILEGRKTQTRRIVKPQPVIDQDSGYKYWDNLMFDIHDDVLETMYMPDHNKIKNGDILWVRETWQHTKCLNINFEDENYGYVYKADAQPWEDYEGWNWKPSIFMPKDACRLFLKVKGVYVEKLQDISEMDCLCEGILPDLATDNPKGVNYTAYKSLWEKINGKDSWAKNPFVWIYEFERCEASFACS